MNEVLERITNTAKEKRIRQYEICKACGISENSFSGWKTGNSESYLKYLPIIADILGVSVDYLTTGKKDRRDILYEGYKEAPKHVQKGIAEILKIDLEDGERAGNH